MYFLIGKKSGWCSVISTVNRPLSRPRDHSVVKGGGWLTFGEKWWNITLWDNIVFYISITPKIWCCYLYCLYIYTILPIIDQWCALSITKHLITGSSINWYCYIFWLYLTGIVYILSNLSLKYIEIIHFQGVVTFLHVDHM